MIRLRSVGQCAIEVGKSRIGPDAERLFAFALYLAVESGRPVGRKELIELFWPAVEETRGQHSLRQVLYRLKTLGVHLVTEHSLVMVARKDVDADHAPFLVECRGPRAEELSERVTGTCLPGYAPRFSQSYAEWLDRHRDLVHAALRRVLVAGIAEKRTRADWIGVQRLAQRCLSLDPLNEEATLAIAEAAAVHGGKKYALTVLDRYLKEIGPEAHEIRLPATVLRRRIADGAHHVPMPLRDGPFVGRASEMSALNGALTRAAASQGSACLLWGEAGIGKSRLVTEFAKGARLQHIQIARVGCQPHDERRSLSAFVDLVPKLLELRGSLGCAPDSMKYLKRLVEHDTSITTPSPDARESEFLFSNIRRSLFDLIDAIAAEATLVIVTEDVHWLDTMSWEIMRDLIPWLASRRVLLVLTSREQDADDRQRGRPVHQLRRVHVGPLTTAARHVLLDALLAHRAVAQEFRDWCLYTSGGNPFYVSELAIHAVEDGGTYRVPPSLMALINERLSRLSPVSRRVLQACAILGKSATLDRVESVLGHARVALLDSLDDLERHALIESDGSRLMTKHELLAHAAVEQLGRSSRRLMHRHAAAMLQREVEQSHASPILWQCAEHWSAAGETDRAVQLLRSCAQHALEMGLPRDASRTLDGALRLPLPEDQVLPLLREQATALQLAGQWEEVLPVLERIVELQGGDKDGVCHTDGELELIDAKWRNGFRLADLFEQLSECVHASDVTALHKVRAATLALMFAANLGCVQRATEMFEFVEACCHAPGVDNHARQYLLMVYHSSFGDHDLAVQAALKLIKQARSSGNVAALTHCLRHSSQVLLSAGRIDDALAAATEAFDIANSYGLSHDAVAATYHLTSTYLQLNDLENASRWQSEAVARQEFSSDQTALANLLATGAEIAIRCGDYAAATSALASAEKLYHRNASAKSSQALLTLRTALALFMNNSSPADDILSELIELHYQMRARGDQDWALFVLCRALQSRDRAQEAGTILRSYILKHRRDRHGLLPQLDSIWRDEYATSAARGSDGNHDELLR
ncbi:MAG TPA: AAA family ATPase [Gemmatimonadaceae bacterium]|nr:AAA family ATPase [Gemmatimonadaceae bacterium]